MKTKPSKNLKEIKLLYVEDDADIREIMAGMLRRYVGELFVASNGSEGLEIFKKGCPEIVLTDIRMPKMDGLTMAEAIKKSDPNVALIFATAFGDTEYLQRAIEVGAQGYLIKPIEREKLVEKLNFIGDAIVNARRKEAYLKLIQTLFNAQKDMIVLLDAKGKVHLSNEAFAHFCDELGCKEERDFAELAERVGPFKEHLKKYGNDLRRALHALHEQVVEYRNDRKVRYFKIDVKSIDRFILLELTDVTKEKLEAIAFAHESQIDELTQVYNRKMLACVKAKALGEERCVVMGDIDHFKHINDTYGHVTGDAVLKGVVSRIKSRIRENDYLIRWGGEEFLIVLQTDYDHALQVAEALRKVVAQKPFETVGEVTMSFGVCCGSIEDEKDVDALIERADKALYAAKEGGRNRVVGCKDLK